MLSEEAPWPWCNQIVQGPPRHWGQRNWIGSTGQGPILLGLCRMEREDSGPLKLSKINFRSFPSPGLHTNTGQTYFNKESLVHLSCLAWPFKTWIWDYDHSIRWYCYFVNQIQPSSWVLNAAVGLPKLQLLSISQRAALDPPVSHKSFVGGSANTTCNAAPVRKVFHFQVKMWNKQASPEQRQLKPSGGLSLVKGNIYSSLIYSYPHLLLLPLLWHILDCTCLGTTNHLFCCTMKLQATDVII